MADVKLRINMESESGSENYDVDIRNGLKSVESLSQSSPDASGVFYGATEGAGSAEIVDVDGKLNTFIADGLIDNSNLPVTILANGKEVQKHISTDSTYNKNSKTLSVRLGNRLNTLDILKYGGYPYPDHSENVANILFDVLSNLRYALFGKDKELTHEEFVEMLSDKHDKDSTLYEYLTSIVNEYPFIESGKTYKDVINEFCIVGQMQMFIDDDDKIRFVSARPKVFDDSNEAIHIEKKNMFSQLDHSVILKNKYDGIELTSLNVNDVTEYNAVVYSENNKTGLGYQNLEAYDSSKINDDNYRVYKDITITQTNRSLATYAYINNYYFEDEITVPKRSKDNLSKILNITPELISSNKDGERIYKYSLTYKEKEYGVHADVVDRSAGTVSLSVTSDNGVSDEITGNLSTSVTATADPVLLTVTKTMDDTSDLQIVYEDEYKYILKYKVLVAQQKVSLTGSATMDYVWDMDGTSIVSEPVKLTFSVYGNKRTITFNNIQSATKNIDTVKTKVSIGASSFVQTQEIADTIKNNILGDYISGVSNGTVKVSCSDYYNQNGEKVIDWTRGQILQVNQVVYFDGDTYQDGSQRYWKIKGRKFQKTGVPFVDLELEEVVVPRALQNYSWEDISKISELGMAKDMFSVGDEKTFRLSNGLDVVAQVVDFDADTKEDGSGKAGITFGLKYLLNEQIEESNGADWGTSSLRVHVNSLMQLLPEPLQKSIKTVNKRATAMVYVGIEGIDSTFGVYNTTDKLWLFSRSEIFGKTNGGFEYEESKQYSYWKDYATSKIKRVGNANGEISSWWLRSGIWEYGSDGALNSGFSIVDTSGELSSMVLPQNTSGVIGSSRICFGFCV